MKSILCLFIVLVLSSFDKSNTKKLQAWNDANFDSLLEKHGKAFIKFFAPWCGHCKRLAPIWEELAETLEESIAPIVEIDCTDAGKQICQKHEVNGYPTIKFVKYDHDGSLGSKANIDYNGPRNLESLVSFAKKHGSPLYKVLSDDQVKSFIDNEYETSFVLFTASKDTKQFKEFVKACEKYVGHALFGVSFTKDIKKLVSYAQPESLIFQRASVLVSKLEKSNGFTYESFEAFIDENLHGKVALRNSGNDEIITKRPLFTVYLATTFQTNASFFKMIRNRLFSLAEKYPNIQFAVASMFDFGGYIYGIGYDSKSHDIIYTIDNEQQQRFVPDSSFKFEDIQKLPVGIEQFVQDFVDGKLEVFIKSGPIPDSQDESKPIVVVAKTFDSIVMDDSKNVFVKMYAPWCGHCKKLAPIWDELAERFKDDKDVVIAKFDVTTNDIIRSEYDVTGFPTLFFAKPGDKTKPVQYNGPRTIEALVEFVKKHTTKPTVVKDEL